MRRDSTSLQRSATQCLLGSIGVVAAVFVCRQLGLNLAAAGFACLILIALLAPIDSFAGLVVLSLVAFACLIYFFAPSLFHLEDRARAVDKWRQALATGEPFEVEARGRSASGEYRWFLVRAEPLRD